MAKSYKELHERASNEKKSVKFMILLKVIPNLVISTKGYLTLSKEEAAPIVLRDVA